MTGFEVVGVYAGLIFAVSSAYSLGRRHVFQEIAQGVYDRPGAGHRPVRRTPGEGYSAPEMPPSRDVPVTAKPGSGVPPRPPIVMSHLPCPCGRTIAVGSFKVAPDGRVLSFSLTAEREVPA